MPCYQQEDPPPGGQVVVPPEVQVLMRTHLPRKAVAAMWYVTALISRKTVAGGRIAFTDMRATFATAPPTAAKVARRRRRTRDSAYPTPLDASF